jgi:hypothetical protein
MKKLLIPLVAAGALALPASALAWGGGHVQHGVFKKASFKAHVRGGMTGTKLDGTGTSFGSTSASVTGTNFSGTLATTWSSATSKTFGSTTMSCAPATASITLSGTATSYTGKTCSTTRNGTTKYFFAGKATDGTYAVLGEDGTTVKGAVFTGRKPGLHMGTSMSGHRGNCSNM